MDLRITYYIDRFEAKQIILNIHVREVPVGRELHLVDRVVLEFVIDESLVDGQIHQRQQLVHAHTLGQ